jgi:cytochrome c biogenesis protein
VGEEIGIPEDGGTFLLRDFHDPYSFKGHNIGEVFFGILTEKNSAPVRVILPVRFPNFDKMRKGGVIISVSAYEPLYYTGLQVTKDPGVWVVYGGFILMIVGSFITFFMSHQRLCVEIRKTRDGSRVVISGIANRNKPGIERKIKNISERLKILSEGTL